jgi:hypothetical protein
MVLKKTLSLQEIFPKNGAKSASYIMHEMFKHEPFVYQNSQSDKHCDKFFTTARYKFGLAAKQSGWNYLMWLAEQPEPVANDNRIKTLLLSGCFLNQLSDKARFAR